MNGVTHVVFNKIDVLREIGQWAVIDKNKVRTFKNEKDMQAFVTTRLKTFSGIPRNKYFLLRKQKEKLQHLILIATTTSCRYMQRKRAII
jgi:hypothetical protein